MLVMRTDLAVVTTAVKERAEMAGSALHLMLPTDFNAAMFRVDKRVKLVSANSPPIEVIVVLPKLVKAPAFSDEKPPSTL